MKTTIYIISVLVLIFTNELSAQKHFQKRKYTKGIFCETIKKLKSDKNQEQQSDVVNAKQENKLIVEQNLNTDSSATKISSAIDLIELPLEIETGIVEKETATQQYATENEGAIKSLNPKTFSASSNNKILSFEKAVKAKQFGLKSSVNNTPDESFFSFIFGDFWKNLGTVLLVLAGISLVVGLLLFIVAVNAPWLYISLGVIAVGAIIYLIIDNSPKKDSESGEKVLAFLEKVGTPILGLLCGIAAAMTRI